MKDWFRVFTLRDGSKREIRIDYDKYGLFYKLYKYTTYYKESILLFI
jgi:hypothetical protein